MRFLLVPALYAAITTFMAAPATAEEGHDHAGHDHGAHAAHEHPTEGPRGGALLELGKEEYHAELLLDEKTNQVTVVLLDSSATKDVAIDTPHLLVNVKDRRKPRQYKLTPLYPEGQAPTGPTAMFALVSPELMADLHSHDVEAKLNVAIGKKSFTAPLHHDHDHEGHNH